MPITRSSRLVVSNLLAPKFQPTANKERDDQCGNQHYSRELLMMGIVMLETCSAYKKKYNKISSGILLAFTLQLLFSVCNHVTFNCLGIRRLGIETDHSPCLLLKLGMGGVLPPLPHEISKNISNFTIYHSTK